MIVEVLPPWTISPSGPPLSAMLCGTDESFCDSIVTFPAFASALLNWYAS